MGANIGYLSLHAASVVGARGRVVSIEAHPRIFSYLSENVSVNGFSNMRLINSAVGSRVGELSFSDRRSDDQNSIVDDGGIRVAVNTLDAISESLTGHVALLKIDVEGYEKEVINGAGNLLERTQCVYFEAWENHYEKYNCSTAEIVTLLRDRGFSVYRIVENKTLAEIDERYHAMQCENLLAIRNVDHFSDRVRLGRGGLFDSVTQLAH